MSFKKRFKKLMSMLLVLLFLVGLPPGSAIFTSQPVSAAHPPNSTIGEEGDGFIVMVEGVPYHRVTVPMPASAPNPINVKGMNISGGTWAGGAAHANHSAVWTGERVRPNGDGGAWTGVIGQTYTSVRTITLPTGAILESIRLYWDSDRFADGRVKFESVNNPDVTISNLYGISAPGPSRQATGWTESSETVIMTITNVGPGTNWHAYIYEFTYLLPVTSFNYDTFGAVGDGITDDFDAIIATHAAANAYAAANPGSVVTVTATDGKTYYIGPTYQSPFDNSNPDKPIINPNPAAGLPSNAAQGRPSRARGNVFEFEFYDAAAARRDEGRSALIQTNVNWGTANFIIDDTTLTIRDLNDDEHYGGGRHIFEVESSHKPIVITVSGKDPAIHFGLPRQDFTGELHHDASTSFLMNTVHFLENRINIPLDLSSPAYKIAPGMTSYGLPANILSQLPPSGALVLAENNQKFQFGRTTGHPGFMQNEVFKIDNAGNILGDIIWDFQPTMLVLYPIDQSTITIEGGNFSTREHTLGGSTQAGNARGYIMRGITVRRSNTILDGISFSITNQRPSTSGGWFPSYRGFFSVSRTHNVKLQNLEAMALNQRSWGTYAMNFEFSTHLTLDNVIQTNFGISGQPGPGAVWGIMGSDFTKDVTINNSKLNRYDAHLGVHNLTVSNSTIGSSGVNLVGSGLAHFSGVTFTGNSSMFTLRDDYGTRWDGNLLIENCIYISPNAAPQIVGAFGGGTFQHSNDFGYSSHLPKNITIDGLTIQRDGGITNLDMFFNFIAADYTGIPPQLPLSKPEHIMLSDIFVANTDGSNALPISRSLVRVANMANEASQTFFGDVSVAWSDFFAITFDTDGGVPSVIPTQHIEGGQTAARPSDPTRAGYHFGGWYLVSDNAFANEFIFATTPILADTDLVARWIETFAVTFDSDGGTSIATQHIPSGSTANRPVNPTKFAHSFVDWHLASDPGFIGGTWGTPFNFSAYITEPVALRARWASSGNIVEFKYTDFGAVGNATFNSETFAPIGINTDDYAAIMATHLAANEHAAANPGDSVVVIPGGTGLVFYIGESSFKSAAAPNNPAMIPIKTDVNWGDAIFLVDDSLITGSASDSASNMGYGAGRAFTDNIFRVEPSKAPVHITAADNPSQLTALNNNIDQFKKYVSVDGNNTILSSGVNSTIMNILADVGIDFYDYDEVMIEVYDATSGRDVYRRVDGPGSPSPGRAMNDRVVVNQSGVFQSAGWIWDFEAITRMNIYPIDKELLTIQGGTFYTIENRAATGTGGRYLGRGLQIGRSNVLVYNVIHRMTNFLPANPSAGGAHGSSSYLGFYHIGNEPFNINNGPWFRAYNVELRDIQLAANTARAQGTYGIVIANAVGITLNNARQTDMLGNCNIQNGGPAGSGPAGQLRQFGVIDMDFGKDIFLTNGTRLNRFDAHMGVHNVDIIDSFIGFDGLNLVGSGTLNFINSSVTGNSPFKLRPDYGTVWDGDMNIINSTINASAADIAIITTWGAYHGQDYGNPSTLPRNTYIENLTVNRINDVNINNWQIVSTPFGRVRVFADFLPSSLNLETARQLGKPLTLSINGIGGTGITSGGGNVFLANNAFPNNTNLFDLVNLVIVPNTYHSVSFVTQSAAIDARKVLSGTTTSRPTADPNRAGFTFTGWFTDAACTTEFNFANPISANTVIWAGWEDSSVWDINGPAGTVVAIDGRVYERVVVMFPRESFSGAGAWPINGLTLLPPSDGDWWFGGGASPWSETDWPGGRVRAGNARNLTLTIPDDAILESLRYWSLSGGGHVVFDSELNSPATVQPGSSYVGGADNVNAPLNMLPQRAGTGWRQPSPTFTMEIFGGGNGRDAYMLEFTYLKLLYDINSPVGTKVEIDGVEYEHVFVNFNDNGSAVTRTQLETGWHGMTFEYPTGNNSDWAPGAPAARNQNLGQIAPNRHNVGWSVAPAPHQFSDEREITLPDGAILTGIRYYWNNWWNHNGHVEFKSPLNPNVITTSTYVNEPGVAGINLDTYVPRLATGWVKPSPTFTADFYFRGNGASRQIYILEFTYLRPTGTQAMHTVSFDPGLGSGTMAPVTVLAGAYTLPTTHTFTPPSGMVFDGWSLTDGGAIIAEAYIQIVADVTLFAIWKSDGADSVESVTVSPNEPSVVKGATQQFTANVAVTGNAEQTVYWTVNGAEKTAAGTTISSTGLLTVSLTEAELLTVTATSTADSTKSGSTKSITLIEPSGIDSVLITSSKTPSVQKNSSHTFTWVVNQTGTAATTVEWTISGNTSAETTVTDGVLYVAADEMAPTLIVTVVSTIDDTKLDVAVVIVTAPLEMPEIVSVTVVPDVVDVRIDSAAGDASGNGTQQFTANVFAKGGAEQNVTWSVSGEASANTAFSYNVLTVGYDETALTLTITATSTFDPTNKFGTAIVNITETPITPAVINVAVSPGLTSVQKGTSELFTAIVGVQGGASTLVNWTVNGGSSTVDETTINSDGTLNVHANESASTLTVRATSIEDPTRFGEATVTVMSVPVAPDVTAVEVTPKAPIVQTGQTQQFAATVTAVDGAPHTVLWSITGNTSIGTTITQNGLLTVAANEMAASITITAASAFNGAISDFAIVTVTQSPQQAVVSVEVSPKTPSVNTGSSQIFNAAVTVTGGAAQTVSWSVAGNNSAQTTMSGNVLNVAANETAATLTVTATSAIDSSKFDTAIVTVTSAQPPAVTSVTVSPSIAIVPRGGTQQFSATVAPAEASQGVTWSVIPQPAGVTIVAGLLTVGPGVLDGTVLTVTATSTADSSVSSSASVTVIAPPPPISASIGNVVIGNTGVRNVVITLTNDTFYEPLTNVNGWITNLPAGLTQTATRTGANQVTITIGGTPTMASSAQIAITIPASSLTNSNTSLEVAVNPLAVFNTSVVIIQPPTGENEGSSGDGNDIPIGRPATGQRPVVSPAPVATPAPSPTPIPVPLSAPTHAPATTEQPSPWAQTYINTATQEGLVPENLRTMYTQIITRAEFAALATALHETVMGYEIEGRELFDDSDDVNVQKMGYLKVVLGDGHGSFMPNDTLTREQAAVILVRLANVTSLSLPPATEAFADSADIAPWAIEAVGQVREAGIMEGIGGGMFSPQGPYTREQSIVTLLRLYWILQE